MMFRIVLQFKKLVNKHIKIFFENLIIILDLIKISSIRLKEKSKIFTGKP